MAQTEKVTPAGRAAGRSDPAHGGESSTRRSDDCSELFDHDPGLFRLFEQITCSLESGQSIDVEQLAAEHPDWAGEIRAQLPVLQGMVRAAASVQGSAPSLTDTRDPEGRRVLGDFRIVREIGRGGMGIVYEAEQAPLGRRVALKVLPMAAALDPRSIQRFQLEAQVAGWLQHPRIVPVYAVGLVNEVPYFAMQLIEGGSLGALLAELRMLAGHEPVAPADDPYGDSPSALAVGLLTGRFAPPGEIVGDRRQPLARSYAEASIMKSSSIRGAAYLRTIARLGIQAAEALSYAHDQGIIHRDVKPANLLLDRRGDLWVADFGMADVQGDAGLTLSGDLPGTLRYMSPEQATGQRALVDRRTDIYSLGATLYELLTLQPAVRGSDKVEIIRKIADEEPAPIRQFNPAVPIDLATIVTKALSKESSKRYQTAPELADDLRRFLEGLPIVARPAGPLVRVWRWCRRKPALAGLAAALVLAIVFGFSGITWNWREAVRQRQEALLQKHEALRQEQEAVRQKQEAIFHEQEAQRQKGLLVVSQSRAEASEKKALTQAAKADAINQFLIAKILRQASPEHNPAGKQVTLLEVLNRAADEVGRSFSDQPEIEAAIRLALGETYHDLGDYARTEKHYRAAYEITDRAADKTAPERFRAMSDLGHSLVHLGRLSEAEPLLVDVTEQARRILGPDHDLSLGARGYLASLRQSQGRYSDAEILERRLVDDYRRVYGTKHSDTLFAINNLGTLLQRQHKYAEAEHLFRECLDLRRAISGPDQPGTIGSAFNLGFVLNELGRVEEAEKLMRQSYEASRRVLGPEHPHTLLATGTLGSVLTKLGRLDEAEKLLRPLLDTQRQTLGPNHPDTIRTAANLDTVLKRRSQPADGTMPARPDGSKP